MSYWIFDLTMGEHTVKSILTAYKDRAYEDGCSNQRLLVPMPERMSDREMQTIHDEWVKDPHADMGNLMRMTERAIFDKMSAGA